MSSYGPDAMPPTDASGSTASAAARAATAHPATSTRNSENRALPICRSNVRKRYSRNHDTQPSTSEPDGSSDVSSRHTWPPANTWRPLSARAVSGRRGVVTREGGYARAGVLRTRRHACAEAPGSSDAWLATTRRRTEFE